MMSIHNLTSSLISELSEIRLRYIFMFLSVLVEGRPPSVDPPGTESYADIYKEMVVNFGTCTKRYLFMQIYPLMLSITYLIILILDCQI